MTKVEKIIQEYKDAYYDLHGHFPKIERKGAWIYINESPSAYRSAQIPDMVERLKVMKKEREVPEPEVPEEDDGDIRALLCAIRQDGRHIFRSKDLNEMQKAGNRIAKMSKRILNIFDEHDEDVASALSKY